MTKLILLLWLIFLPFPVITTPLYAKETPSHSSNENIKKEKASTSSKAGFCSNQVLARPIDHGFTWTLASRLGQLLTMAEEEYGERNKDWTILGTEFNNDKQPRNWHPTYSNDSEKNKNIIIQLTPEAAQSKKEAVFQLSHEIFHALMPTGGKQKATFFEEGLATYFSIQATRKAGIDIETDYIGSGKYRRAYGLVLALYGVHPNASKTITAFRKIGVHPSSLSKNQLKLIFPKLDDTIAGELAKKF